MISSLQNNDLERMPVGSVKVKFFWRNAKFFHARWLGVLGAVRVGVQWVELAAWLALRTVLHGRLVGGDGGCLCTARPLTTC
jgi:hypothetical protein